MEQMELEKKLRRKRRFFCLKNTRRRKTIFGEGKYFRKENICGWIAACIQKAKEGMKSRT